MQNKNDYGFYLEDSGIIKKYLGLPETGQVGKANLELLRDFRELDSHFVKYKRLVGSLMFIIINYEKFNDMEDELRVAINTLKVTKNSLGKQSGLISMICSKLKVLEFQTIKLLRFLSVLIKSQ